MAAFMVNTDRTYIGPSFLLPAADHGTKFNKHSYMSNISENNLEIFFFF